MILTEMTFQQFLQNPTGPYSSFFGKRENIKLDLELRFNKLLANAKDKEFPITVQYVNNGDCYFHIKTPSEQYANIFYDVVIQLTPKMEAAKTEGTFLNYNLLFFSNSPSFVYTYAFVSRKDKLLIPFLTNKIDNIALTTPPTVKNPIEIYGFEKSIYFALLYIKYKNYHVKTALLPAYKTKMLNKAVISSKCKDSKTIMIEYNAEKKKEQLKKQTEKRQKTTDKIAEQRQRMTDARDARNAKSKFSSTSVNKVIKPKKALAPMRAKKKI